MDVGSAPETSFVWRHARALETNERSEGSLRERQSLPFHVEIDVGQLVVSILTNFPAGFEPGNRNERRHGTPVGEKKGRRRGEMTAKPFCAGSSEPLLGF